MAPTWAGPGLFIRETESNEFYRRETNLKLLKELNFCT